MAKQDDQIGTVGERIRMARQKRDLSSRDLAASIDVSHALISRWENDIVYPRLDEAIDLCAALDVPLSWLIEGIGAKPLMDMIGLPTDFKTGNR